MAYVKDIFCIKCSARYAFGTLFPCRECGGSLDVQYDYDRISDVMSKSILEKRVPGLWKYKEFLPIKKGEGIVSLGEGGTPLIKCDRLADEIGIKNLYIKDETRNPTGSFKDRHASVTVSMALEDGFRRIVSLTSGNEGAALACYSSRAGIKSLVFIHPEPNSIKLSQVMYYGATVVSAPKPSEEPVTFWQKGREQKKGASFFSLPVNIWREGYKKYGWYPSMASPINPYHKEGYKTIAHEICEQLNWKAPEFVIVPTASGDNLAGEWKGFKEYYNLGLIDTLPKIIAAQYERGPKGGYIGHDLSKISIEESKGLMVYTAQDKNITYVKLLATKEGLLVEPCSASSVACISKLIEAKKIDRNDVVVCIATGHGIKVPELAQEICNKPIEIEVSPKAIIETLKKYR